MFKLIIEDDEGKTTVVPLIRDEITIGRKEGNTIRLTERNVSRRHAKLTKQNGSVFIEDLGSYNGIRVNGNRIAGRIAVVEGDRIQIGDYLLALKLDRAAVTAVGRPSPGPGAAGDPFADLKTVPVERRLDGAAGVQDEGTRPPGGVAGGNGAGAIQAAEAEGMPDEALDSAPTIPVSTR